jgi:hypothetical protein
MGNGQVFARDVGTTSPQEIVRVSEVSASIPCPHSKFLLLHRSVSYFCSHVFIAIIVLPASMASEQCRPSI